MELSRIAAVAEGHKPPVPVWLIGTIAGGLFAALAIFTLQSPLNHFSSIDPILYEAYIHNYKEMMRIYGYTYYSSRIAWIAPSIFFNYIFGDIAGYYLIRLIMMWAAATSFCILVARFCRWQLTMYAAAWFCLLPVILRGFADDYIQGPAITYSTIAVACVLTAKPKVIVQHAIGGIFFALGLNSYPMSFVVASSIICAWLVLRRKTKTEINFENALSALIGFGFTYFIIWLVLRWEFSQLGKPFELFPTSTIASLVSGGAAAWFTSLNATFVKAGQYVKLYTLFVMCGLIIAYLGYNCRKNLLKNEISKKEYARVFSIICVSTIFVYLCMHFLISAGAIFIPWAYIFCIPLSGLAGIFLIDLITPDRNLVLVCAIGIIVLLLTISPELMNVTFYVPKLVWLFLGVLLAASGLIVAIPRLAKIWPVPVAAALFFPIGFYTANAGMAVEFEHGSGQHLIRTYVSSMRHEGSFGPERDLRNGTFQLMDDVNNLLPPDQQPGLWYANNTGFADEVGSAFLWQYSRVASTDDGDPGMPRINDAAQKKIESYTYLVLIGRTQTEVEAGQRALETDGFTIEPVLDRKAGGRSFSFFYRIVRKQGVKAGVSRLLDRSQ